MPSDARSSGVLAITDVSLPVSRAPVKGASTLVATAIEPPPWKPNGKPVDALTLSMPGCDRTPETIASTRRRACASSFPLSTKSIWASASCSKPTPDGRRPIGRRSPSRSSRPPATARRSRTPATPRDSGGGAIWAAWRPRPSPGPAERSRSSLAAPARDRTRGGEHGHPHHRRRQDGDVHDRLKGITMLRPMRQLGGEVADQAGQNQSATRRRREP